MHRMCNTSQHSRRFPSLVSPLKSNHHSLHSVPQQGALPALEFHTMDSCYWSNVTRQAMLLFMTQQYSTRGFLFNLLLGSPENRPMGLFSKHAYLCLLLENITRNRIMGPDSMRENIRPGLKRQAIKNSWYPKKQRGLVTCSERTARPSHRTTACKHGSSFT